MDSRKIDKIQVIPPTEEGSSQIEHPTSLEEDSQIIEASAQRRILSLLTRATQEANIEPTAPSLEPAPKKAIDAKAVMAARQQSADLTPLPDTENMPNRKLKILAKQAGERLRLFKMHAAEKADRLKDARRAFTARTESAITMLIGQKPKLFPKDTSQPLPRPA